MSNFDDAYVRVADRIEDRYADFVFQEQLKYQPQSELKPVDYEPDYCGNNPEDDEFIFQEYMPNIRQERTGFGLPLLRLVMAGLLATGFVSLLVLW